MRVPQVLTTTLATAVSSGGTYIYNLKGVDRASIQLNATLSAADTSVMTLQISNDGVNFVGFSTAKTATLTGGGTTTALFELGPIDYAYLRVSYGTPSAGTLTLVSIINVVATLVQIV